MKKFNAFVSSLLKNKSKYELNNSTKYAIVSRSEAGQALKFNSDDFDS